MRIDSHHHFWQYNAQEYGWISDSMQVLRRDFLPEHLEAECRPAQVMGVVSVQARQTLEETRWLLAQARSKDWIRGVVGWLPLEAPNISELLTQFQNDPKLRAVRHVVQDETDPGFLDRSAFNAGIRSLQAVGLTYDILIYAKQLPMAIRFAKRHPEQVFVLDHIAKPTIQGNTMDADWKRDVEELAKCPNVFCKFSGVATEVRDSHWTVPQIQPYWEVALDAFGADRLMFGTDWPVCLLKTTYMEWVTAVEVLASKLSSSEQANFWANNAIRAYHL